MFIRPEQPESFSLLKDMQSMGEYLRRQESSERTIVCGGQCHTLPGKTADGNGSLESVEECTEHVSKREELLQRQVIELQERNDELSRQLAEAHDTYPEAEISSDSLSESLSRVEKAVLIRSQSAPERLLTAYKKIETLQVRN